MVGSDWTALIGICKSIDAVTFGFRVSGSDARGVALRPTAPGQLGLAGAACLTAYDVSTNVGPTVGSAGSGHVIVIWF